MMERDLYNKIRAGCLLSVALALAACTNPSQPPNIDVTAQPQATRTPLATRAVQVDSSVTANGVVALRVPVVQAGFDVTGKISAVKVTLGQTVKPGDLLATIDDTDLRDAVEDAALSLALTDATIRQQAAPIAPEDIDAAKAALASAHANYANIKAGVTQGEKDTARRNAEAAWLAYLASQLNRDAHCGTPLGTATLDCKAQEAQYGNAYESMLNARAAHQKTLEPVSQNTLTQAYASVTSAQNKLDALNAATSPEQRKIAELQHEQAKSALARAQARLVKATLVSPCACIVQEIKVAVGGSASAAAFVLVDIAELQFQTTNLTERDLTGMRPGAAVTVRLKAHQKPFNGKVATVLSQSSGAQSGVALFTVLIDLDAADARLLPGMTGQAEILLP